VKDVSIFIKVAVASRQAFKENKSHSFKNSTFSVKRKSVLLPVIQTAPVKLSTTLIRIQAVLLWRSVIPRLPF
jgi:hypothetical protein